MNLRFSALMSLLVLAGILGGMILLLQATWPAAATPDEQLQAALAEANALDPGWCSEQRNGIDPMVMGEDAAIVSEVCSRLPPDWPEPPLHGLDRIAPPVQLSRREHERLEEVLAHAIAAREEAGKLAHRAAERRIPPDPVPQGASPSERPCAVRCAELLAWQSWLQAEENDARGALDSVCGMIRAGQSLDELPSVLAQAERLLIQNRACRTLQRVLAQTRPGDDDLRSVQQVLQQELQHPGLLWMIRGEWLRCYRALQQKQGREGPAPPAGACCVQDLRWYTRAAQIAALPLPVQEPLLEGLKAALQAVPARERGGSDPSRFSRGWLENRARMHCALVALALERYRLAHRYWPATLAELGPGQPCDPFEGKPLGYRHRHDGVEIYSRRADSREPASFRLWSPEQRRQTARGQDRSEDDF